MEKENYSTDDKLIELTKSYAGELITNDVYCKLKAISKGVRTSGYGSVEDYSGIYYWDIDTDENKYSLELDKAINENILPERLSLKKNQYIIARIDNEIVGLFIHLTDGKLRPVTSKTIRNSWSDKIRPKNPEQICLVDALYSDSTIIYAGGVMGTGKSFLLNNFALQQLERGEINKIVYIPNNAYVQDSMEIGMLPGTSFEKITPLIGSLVDLIGIDEVIRLLQVEQLEIVPLAYLRGRNFDNSIVIVNEAQNLNANHVKLLIGRIGNNSRIFWDGSLQQIDSELFKNTNGLRSLLKLSNSPYADMFSTVRLNKVERSKTAQIADYLDRIGGF